MARSRLISKVSARIMRRRQPIKAHIRTLVHLDVDGSPPDVVFGGFFIDNTLVLGAAAGLLSRKVDEGTRRGNDSAFVADCILIEQSDGCIALDLDAIHIEASLREVVQMTTND